MSDSVLVCALCGKPGDIKLSRWGEPSEKLGDTHKIASICEDCALIHWAGAPEG